MSIFIGDALTNILYSIFSEMARKCGDEEFLLIHLYVTISRREGSTNKYLDMSASSEFGHFKGGSDIERDDIP